MYYLQKCKKKLLVNVQCTTRKLLSKVFLFTRHTHTTLQPFISAGLVTRKLTRLSLSSSQFSPNWISEIHEFFPISLYSVNSRGNSSTESAKNFWRKQREKCFRADILHRHTQKERKRERMTITRKRSVYTLCDLHYTFTFSFSSEKREKSFFLGGEQMLKNWMDIYEKGWWRWSWCYLRQEWKSLQEWKVQIQMRT